MRKLLFAAGLFALLAGQASAQTVGVSLVSFDINFQTLLREGIQKRATEVGADVQFEDAQNDSGKQLDQVRNFIASGVDAIIVTLVDTSASQAITAAAEEAGIPLVYVNLAPQDLSKLPEKQAYVGSDETESGTLSAFEACKILRSEGKAKGVNGYIIIGSLSHQAALQRTKDVEDIVATDMCNFIKIREKQSSDWAREKSLNLVTNWLSSGGVPDVIFANNDESALGAILALKAANISMKDVVVVGVDATADALSSMKAGELDATVFQNANAQGGGGLDVALKLVKGEKVDKVNYVPFELVNLKNIDEYVGKN
ncbi:substrate-binding domain-containing protein [Rhizobium leguminosarum]